MFSLCQSGQRNKARHDLCKRQAGDGDGDGDSETYPHTATRSAAVPPQGGQVATVMAAGRAWQQTVRQSHTSSLQQPTALMSVLNLQV